MSPRLASWLGYDPVLVAPLPVGHQRSLAVVAACALPGLFALALSAAYGTYLASDTLALAVVVGVGAGLYLLNLLRVSVAGGGAAAHQPVRQASTWAPRAVPLIMLALLGGFFAQPLALWWFADEQDEAIARLKASLGQMHEAAVLGTARRALDDARAALDAARTRAKTVQNRLDSATRELDALARADATDGSDVEQRVLMAAIGDDRSALVRLSREVEDGQRRVAELTLTEQRVRTEDVAVYRAHLERSHFLVRRVQLAWAAPTRPLFASMLMVLLMVLPWVASASLGRSAHRAYEVRRWAATRALVEVAYGEARRLEADALKVWPNFTKLREELFLDPPYNTRPRGGFGHHHG